MCGLLCKFGALDAKDVVNNDLESFSRRGPDEFGDYVDLSVGAFMQHFRLSIVGGDFGKQPVVSDSGRFVIVFNGEVYNYRKLRERLPFQYKTVESDTLILCGLISRMGVIDALQLVDGMFSIVVFDRVANEVFVARDVFGEKPLYWGLLSGKLVVSSLAGSNFDEPQLDNTAVRQYFAIGGIVGPQCVFSGVNKVLPGRCLRFKLSKNQTPKLVDESLLSRRSSYLNRHGSIGSGDDALNHLHQLLAASVETRIGELSNVGLFLSGGIDSSIVGRLAINALSGLRTYSIGMHDDPNSELPAATAIANFLGSDHVEMRVNDEDLVEGCRLIEEADEPIGDSSLVLSGLLAKEARKRGKVILTGDGADELFAGYRRHVYLGLLLLGQRLGLAPTKVDQLVSMFTAKRSGSTFSAVNDDWLRQLYVSFLSRGALHNDSDATVFKFLGQEQEPRKQSVNTMKDFLELDLTIYMPNHVLKKMDFACMHNSLENRAPFLNKEIFNFSNNISDCQFVRLHRNKIMLRKLHHKLFQGRFQSMRKKGFDFPKERLLTGILSEELNELLNSDFARLTSEILKIKSIAEMPRFKSSSECKWRVYSFLKWGNKQYAEKFAR